MGIFKLITQKKKGSNPNQEFLVHQTDDYNDGMTRMYNQNTRKENEIDIIKNIKNGSDYRTENPVSGYTKCEVGIRNGQEYLKSKPNGSDKDNIENLTEYI